MTHTMAKILPEKTIHQPQLLRVLIIEDRLADAELVTHVLRKGGFEVCADVVQAPHEFSERLASKSYDIVLADYRLPNWNGMDALVILQGLRKDIPFILMSGSLGDEIAVECIKKGATDYVLKDRLARLPSAIRRALEDRWLRKEQARVEAALSQLAHIVESSDDAIVGATLEGTILNWNSGAERLYDYSAQEVKGRSISILASLDHPDEILRSLEMIKRGEVLKHFETAQTRKDGEQVHVSLTISPVKDAVGNILGVSTIARDIGERKRLEARLVHQANHDPLTDLFNRRHFIEEVERHLAHVRRYGTGGALLFLDLDRFKDINDSLSHLIGDEVLVTLAGLLQQGLRETDTVARLGGDEFAILLPHSDADQARSVAQHLLDAVRSHTVVAGERRFGITASIGIVVFPQHGTTADELLARADLALYKAKENGRNRLVIYTLDGDWQAKTESRLVWQKRIREALEKNLFFLDAQPVMHLRSNQICQYELLLRLDGDKGEIILPAAFLEIGERFGLIHEIDRWVMRQAIQLIAQHRRAGRALCLEVNLSGKAFGDSELLPMIERELATTAVSPTSLILEVTETAAIANIPCPTPKRALQSAAGEKSESR